MLLFAGGGVAAAAGLLTWTEIAEAMMRKLDDREPNEGWSEYLADIKSDSVDGRRAERFDRPRLASGSLASPYDFDPSAQEATVRP